MAFPAVPEPSATPPDDPEARVEQAIARVAGKYMCPVCGAQLRDEDYVAGAGHWAVVWCPNKDFKGTMKVLTYPDEKGDR